MAKKGVKLRIYNGVQCCTIGSVKGECFTVSIKDYAREAGVSYEAVRKQMKRYTEELEGHIHQQGRTQYLDDEAVAFLDQHRLDRPIVISEAGYDRKVRELEDDKAMLEEAVKQLQAKLIAAHEQLRLSEGAQAKLEAAETEKNAMRELADGFKSMADQRAAEVEAANQRADALTRELVKIASMGKLKKLFYTPQIENE